MNINKETPAHPPVDVSEQIMAKWQNLLDLAAQIIGIPAGLIMRITGDDIEVFVSSRTKGNPYKAGEREKLLGSGLYCEKVIRTLKHLHVPFAPEDSEWSSNPDIALNMNSYLGYPLVMPDGQVFGTICVLDSVERRFDERTFKLMEQFRELVESHLALDRAKTKLEEHDRLVRADIALAQAWQKNFAPESFVHGRIEAVSVYEPSFHLSGDFYSPFALDDQLFGMVIGDVSSKGLSAALRSVALLTLSKNLADSSVEPSGMLSRLNSMFIDQEIEASRFCTMIYLRVNSNTGEIDYARAGHELPLWFHASSGEVTVLEEGELPVGLVKDPQYGTRTIKLEPGDRLLLYTDGLSEISCPDGGMLGANGLKRMMADAGSAPPADMARHAVKLIEECRKGAPLLDDLTFTAIGFD